MIRIDNIPTEMVDFFMGKKIYFAGFKHIYQPNKKKEHDHAQSIFKPIFTGV